MPLMFMHFRGVDRNVSYGFSKCVMELDECDRSNFAG
jgi:hypothetical protein